MLAWHELHLPKCSINFLLFKPSYQCNWLLDVTTPGLYTITITTSCIITLNISYLFEDGGSFQFSLTWLTWTDSHDLATYHDMHCHKLRRYGEAFLGGVFLCMQTQSSLCKWEVCDKDWWPHRTNQSMSTEKVQ